MCYPRFVSVGARCVLSQVQALLEAHKAWDTKDKAALKQTFEQLVRSPQ